MIRAKTIHLTLCVAVGLGLAGCGKKETTPASKATNATETGETALGKSEAAVAQSTADPRIIGMAKLVPGDSDWFVASPVMGQEVAEMTKRMFEIWGNGPLEIDPNDPGTPTPENFNEFTGQDWFAYGGPGLEGVLASSGEIFHLVNTELVSIVYEKLASVRRGTFREEMDAEGNQRRRDFLPILKALGDELQEGGRLAMPPTVISWRPDEGRVSWIVKKIQEAMSMKAADDSQARPLEFSAHGVEMKGYAIDGEVFFRSLIENLQEPAEDPEREAMRNDPRTIQLREGLKNFEFCVACGELDGRVMIFIGKDEDGFRIAANEAESLAGRPNLAWQFTDPDAEVTGAAYLSGNMLRGILPWLDVSGEFGVMARVANRPEEDERARQARFEELAELSKAFAAREPSDWSAVVAKKDGWHVETAGGWPDPRLDYEAPLRFAGPAAAQDPALRVHWVQNRERHEQLLRAVELQIAIFGSHMRKILGAEAGEAGGSRVDEEFDSASKFFERLRIAWQQEFRAGVGDEVAVVMDFRGEVPSVPGLPADFVRSGHVPRFIIARPVTDRQKIAEAGATIQAVWKEITGTLSETANFHIPVIEPQKVTSGGMTTWYAPAPFIGGDFVPGATVGNDVWTLGTSRKLTRNFAESVREGGLSAPSPTGCVIEVDFEQVGDWVRELAARDDLDTDQLVDQFNSGLPSEMTEGPGKEMREEAISEVRRLKGFSYWHRMENGQPRTSMHLQMKPVELPADPPAAVPAVEEDGEESE